VTATVLVVDDHAEFRLVARMMLETGGFRVVGEAATGAEALCEAVVRRPEIVLVDVQLPDMDGFAVSRELRRLVPSTIVVICSVGDAGDYATRVGDCGARGFLTKSALSAAAVTRLVAGR
jgi:DNA-binding NarL/FixJ family response regulator